MTISVNNKSQSVSENTSIVTLLAQLNVASNGIAVAINNEVISKENWNKIQLQKEDHVTIIQATQGG
ncbi:sulfur carrier protein ThiS [Aquimarina sp. AD10]|uniref:Thiamine biosynthesis protein n=1 Tax=Aquimarina aggregata TaxID=1642818 RepID=A0A162ZLK4_9FLAO|nr:MULTISPECIES: sulfur carrier protein ThiS [Aquimarina]AXT62204.1 sulfur carrier protein ThiS [Aquimarina sp. AD10]KZS39888.1 thiamine biosynthesis protein [Aquimarina aggregata]RKM90601.1 sulfur carrier protein ThiS [Aquimarina sp. AD10]